MLTVPQLTFQNMGGKNEVGRPCFNSFFLLPPTLTKLYKRIKKTKKMKRTKRTKKKKIKIVETKASRRSVSEAVILLLYE